MAVSRLQGLPDGLRTLGAEALEAEQADGVESAGEGVGRVVGHRWGRAESGGDTVIKNIKKYIKGKKR